jgi:hypothetical protein
MRGASLKRSLPEARNLRLLLSVAPLEMRHRADDQTRIWKAKAPDRDLAAVSGDRRPRPNSMAVCVCVCVCERKRVLCVKCVCVCEVCVCVCGVYQHSHSQSGLPKESKVGSDIADCDQSSPLALCPSAPDSANAKQAGSPLQGQLVSNPVDTKATQARSVARVFRWPV